MWFALPLFCSRTSSPCQFQAHYLCMRLMVCYYATRDAGEHWALLATNVDTIKALCFIDPLWGWAVGDTKLWQTVDGGRHWSEIPYQITAE